MVLPTRPYTLSSYASIPSASHDINTIARVQEFKISAELLISLEEEEEEEEQKREGGREGGGLERRRVEGEE